MGWSCTDVDLYERVDLYMWRSCTDVLCAAGGPGALDLYRRMWSSWWTRIGRTRAMGGVWGGGGAAGGIEQSAHAFTGGGTSSKVGGLL